MLNLENNTSCTCIHARTHTFNGHTSEAIKEVAFALFSESNQSSSSSSRTVTLNTERDI